MFERRTFKFCTETRGIITPETQSFESEVSGTALDTIQYSMKRKF